MKLTFDDLLFVTNRSRKDPQYTHDRRLFSDPLRTLHKSAGLQIEMVEGVVTTDNLRFELAMIVGARLINVACLKNEKPVSQRRWSQYPKGAKAFSAEVTRLENAVMRKVLAAHLTTKALDPDGKTLVLSTFHIPLSTQREVQWLFPQEPIKFLCFDTFYDRTFERSYLDFINS